MSPGSCCSLFSMQRERSFQTSTERVRSVRWGSLGSVATGCRSCHVRSERACGPRYRFIGVGPAACATAFRSGSRGRGDTNGFDTRSSASSISAVRGRRTSAPTRLSIVWRSSSRPTSRSPMCGPMPEVLRVSCCVSGGGASCRYRWPRVGSSCRVRRPRSLPTTTRRHSPRVSTSVSKHSRAKAGHSCSSIRRRTAGQDRQPSPPGTGVGRFRECASQPRAAGSRSRGAMHAAMCRRRDSGKPGSLCSSPPTVAVSYFLLPTFPSFRLRLPTYTFMFPVPTAVGRFAGSQAAWTTEAARQVR